MKKRPAAAPTNASAAKVAKHGTGKQPEKQPATPRNATPRKPTQGRQSVTEPPPVHVVEHDDSSHILEVVDAYRLRQEKIWEINMASNESTIRAEAALREDTLRAQLEKVKTRTRDSREALRLQNEMKEEDANREMAAYREATDKEECELRQKVTEEVAKVVAAEAELRVYHTAGLMTQLCSSRDKLLALEVGRKPEVSPADSSTTASSTNSIQQEPAQVAEPPPTRTIVETRNVRPGSMHVGAMWNLPSVNRFRFDEEETTEPDRSTNRKRIIGCEHELAALHRPKTASRELPRWGPGDDSRRRRASI